MTRQQFRKPDGIPFRIGDRVEQIHGGPVVKGRQISPLGTITEWTERGFVVTFDESMGLNSTDRRCEMIAKDHKYLRKI
jgi:hypothetical protein